MKGNDGTGNVVERDDWQTPQWLFDKLHSQYTFIFDCCATRENSKCAMYSPNFKVIEKDLGYTFWMNPPFSLAREMFEHFFKVVEKGISIYRCDNMETKLWQEVILKNADWVFIPQGRISYEGKEGTGSRFPSALIGKGLDAPKELEGYTLFVKNAVHVQEEKI